MYYKLATAAAKWWCKEIKNRYRKLHFGEITTSFEEKVSLFEQVLISEIHQQLEIFHYISIGCYYFPDKTLAKIAKEADLDKFYLPIHAHLEIVNGSILVSSGYDDPYKLNINL